MSSLKIQKKLPLQLKEKLHLDTLVLRSLKSSIDLPVECYVLNKRSLSARESRYIKLEYCRADLYSTVTLPPLLTQILEKTLSDYYALDFHNTRVREYGRLFNTCVRENDLYKRMSLYVTKYGDELILEFKATSATAGMNYIPLILNQDAAGKLYKVLINFNNNKYDDEIYLY